MPPLPPIPAEALAKMKEIVDKGPPPEPSMDNPGRHMRALLAFEADFEAKHGRPVTDTDRIGFLLLLLDKSDWEMAMLNYRQMEQVVVAAGGGGRILRPDFIPPRDLGKGPRPGGQR